MIADFGYIALLLALIAALYAVGAAWYGYTKDRPDWVASARNGIIITLPLIALSCGLLIVLLVKGDFSIAYVWQVTSRESPTYLKVTALWGSQAGSLLFWNLLLSGFTAIAMARKWSEQKELMPVALIIVGVTQIFFLGVSLFLENPFARLDFVPADGQGLSPLLRHPGMIIHPPLLYLGFVGFVIPYAFAMSALVANKLDDAWIQTTRRWTLVAWMFLSLGLILGGRWAYDVLGWGGYWGWDPVENASFLPWLAGTAFLHSVMIQEKRNMFKMWNMFLVTMTFVLVILGTFIVRSGVISSVHSFARSPIGPYFFGFVTLLLVFSAYWLTKRRTDLASENQISSFLSREAAFLYNNFLILAILLIVMLFTYYPIISELFTGERGFVGAPVYERALAPLFVLLLLLMGVAPLTMWYRTSAKRLGMALRWPALATAVAVIALFINGIRSLGALTGLGVVIFSAILTLLEFWKGTRGRMKRGEAPWTAFANLMMRNRRRYGGYWIHLGVIVMAFGIIGLELFQEQTQPHLAAGESVTIGNYEMIFKGVERRPGPDDLIITEATVDVFEYGRFVKTLHPRTELYTRTQQPMTIPSMRSTISEDFYVLLVLWEPASADEATFRIYVNPLANWVWGGGVIFVLGTMIATWPDKRKKRERVARPRQVAVAGD